MKRTKFSIVTVPTSSAFSFYQADAAVIDRRARSNFAFRFADKRPEHFPFILIFQRRLVFTGGAIRPVVEHDGDKQRISLFKRSHELSSDRSKFSSYYLATTIGYRRSKTSRLISMCRKDLRPSFIPLPFAHCYGRKETEGSRCRKNDDIKVALRPIESYYFHPLLFFYRPR